MAEHLTVGRVAGLAGVTVHALHHYDEIGLVRPSARTPAGYRAYSAGDVERLRDVLAYRQLGFGLREIADLVDDPATDAVAHLRRLRGLLVEQRDRADAMVAGIDRELQARAMGVTMTPEEQLGVLGVTYYDAIGSAYAVLRRRDGLQHRPHWQDPVAGLREMRRVARRVVVFTYDASEFAWRRRFWLTRDYLPEAAGLASQDWLPRLAAAIGARTEPVLIPWDCADGFLEAYWRRPGAYLEEQVRRACSVWARVGPEAEQRAVRALRAHLDSGRWTERNCELADLDAAELGLRLLVA